MGVWNQWNGMVEWNDGIEWWNGLTKQGSQSSARNSRVNMVGKTVDLEIN